MSDYAKLRAPIAERVPVVTYTNLFRPRAETVWVSPQVERITGYRREEWLGKPGFLESVVHPDDRGPVLREVRASRDELRAFNREYRLVARDGRVVWIHDESVPIVDEEGRPELIQGFFVDITERKRLEQELDHAHKEGELGRLARDVAHDLNNHLTAIRGDADAIAGSLAADAPAQKHVGQILAAVGRAARLTRQLLDFARRPSAPAAVVVDDVVRESEPMLARIAGDGVGIVLVLRDTPAVLVDSGQLEQVLVNLVANARDAMPHGGLVSIRTYATTLSSSRAERLGVPPGAYVTLVVADNGVGMDEDVRARAFEPFFSTKDEEQGAGLGLSIVERMVRRAGGVVELQSSPGGGTTVRIQLPVATVG